MRFTELVLQIPKEILLRRTLLAHAHWVIALYIAAKILVAPLPRYGRQRVAIKLEPLAVM